MPQEYLTLLPHWEQEHARMTSVVQAEFAKLEAVVGKKKQELNTKNAEVQRLRQELASLHTLAYLRSAKKSALTAVSQSDPSVRTGASVDTTASKVASPLVSVSSKPARTRDSKTANLKPKIARALIKTTNSRDSETVKKELAAAVAAMSEIAKKVQGGTEALKVYEASQADLSKKNAAIAPLLKVKKQLAEYSLADKLKALKNLKPAKLEWASKVPSTVCVQTKGLVEDAMFEALAMSGKLKHNSIVVLPPDQILSLLGGWEIAPRRSALSPPETFTRDQLPWKLNLQKYLRETLELAHRDENYGEPSPEVMNEIKYKVKHYMDNAVRGCNSIVEQVARQKPCVNAAQQCKRVSLEQGNPQARNPNMEHSEEEEEDEDGKREEEEPEADTEADIEADIEADTEEDEEEEEVSGVAPFCPGAVGWCPVTNTAPSLTSRYWWLKKDRNATFEP
eukprot:GILK01010060.1.p1 GENE.GILK01010060.1~~GILK01010060.1.p1  ORF type:complete len:452 (+),score=86.70 GILK01010060.1:1052-2407(+)